MSVICFLEISGGVVKKSSLEAAALGAALAKTLNVPCVAFACGKIDQALLQDAGNYGVSQVLHISETLPSPAAYASAMYEAIVQTGSKIAILAKSVCVDGFASAMAVKMQATMASNVCDVPDVSNGFKIKRSIYTGKAFAYTELTSEHKVLIIQKNAYIPTPSTNKAEVKTINYTLQPTDTAMTTKETIKASTGLLLTEAEIVVSGGRGMKGPENWHLIENLASALGAATGCSKPVSDMDWRPHHEHVGQTGVKVSPNIYIAVGISGAIQHLAGVNTSKCIVVINKDPEAPFFKAADYGIVGDAFEVLPKLIEAAKKLSR